MSAARAWLRDAACAVKALAWSPDGRRVVFVSNREQESDATYRTDLWVVDALRFIPHPSHFSVTQALQWIECVGTKRGILTHMTSELDYAAMRRDLPAHIEPAYDGMVIEVE